MVKLNKDMIKDQWYKEHEEELKQRYVNTNVVDFTKYWNKIYDEEVVYIEMAENVQNMVKNKKTKELIEYLKELC